MCDCVSIQFAHAVHVQERRQQVLRLLEYAYMQQEHQPFAVKHELNITERLKLADAGLDGHRPRQLHLAA